MNAVAMDGVVPMDTKAGARRWTGRVLSGIAMLFLTVDAAVKLIAAPEAVVGTVQLGYKVEVLPVLAALQIVCLVAYLVPRAAIIGAVLWTGYLGGAVATHVRVGSPLFSHTLFPVYVAVLLWAGLYLRDARVAAAIGPRR